MTLFVRPQSGPKGPTPAEETDPYESPWYQLDREVRPRLRAAARRRGLDREAADDVVQEVYLRLLIHLAAAGPILLEEARRFALGVVRFRIADHHRDRVRRANQSTGSDLDQFAARDSSVDGRGRDLERVRELLRRLAEGSATSQRTLEVMRRLYVHRDRSADVAESLGMSPNAVYLARHHCLRRLRALYASETGACSRPTPRRRACHPRPACRR